MSTETADPRFVAIDRWATVDAVEAMLEGQMSAIAAIKDQVQAIAHASDAAAARLKTGGRLIYAGAGTSGRIAVQDGVELSPTYGWSADRLGFVIAGGMAALSHSAEGAEDDADDARAQIAARGVGPADVVIGVAASGGTPFTVAAVAAARALGALTIGVANNRDTRLALAADHALVADTGSELIAGSTRMKAGTAQKAILNLFSTATMLRCGRVYRGLMVNMVVSNDKLAKRACAMVVTLTQCSADAAVAALDAADNSIALAVLIAMGHGLTQARNALAACDGNLALAIEHLAQDARQHG
jgi:N-acetylmuramic acid 6-phosphate etherase